MNEYGLYRSPLGLLRLTEEADALTEVAYLGAGTAETEAPTLLLRSAVAQLEQYFSGARRDFDLPLRPRGTPFQCEVWSRLLRIPYGQTCTYGQLAAAMGKPQAARAVGGAAHCNPLPLLIPCHRLVGANGSLTGFAWGLEVKARLLELESADQRRTRK